MPTIIPIRDLKDTVKISELCHASKEPIYVTKNGYGDMVLMSMALYQEQMFLNDVYLRLQAAEEQVQAGQTIPAEESMRKLREQLHG